MPQDKPDVTAYTHFLGSEIDPGKPDSGISAACPVAAGCVAALRTKIRPLQVSPAFLFRILQISTRQVGGPPGWNQDYGFGIINPVFAGQKLGLIPP
jgi:hypothetical protein